LTNSKPSSYDKEDVPYHKFHEHPDDYATIEWQEVEEPEKMIIVCAEVEDGAMINPAYTQFQTDIKSGNILAEITKLAVI